MFLWGFSVSRVSWREQQDSIVFNQGGSRPLPPLGRRSALHPGSFSLDAQKKGTKRNPFGPGPTRPAVTACHWQARPPAASAEFFAGGRTNSRISDSVAPSVASSTSDRPSTSHGADRTGPAPLPAKNSSHNAFMGRKNQPKSNKNTHGKP